MKIVDYETFLEMPEGIIFAPSNGLDFDGLLVKGETIRGGGWNGPYSGYWSLDPGSIAPVDGEECILQTLRAFDGGTGWQMNDCYSKHMSYDGDLEERSYYLIFEADDLEALKGYIDVALKIIG